MQLNTKTYSIFTRFPIITWVGALFCFVVFPLIALNYGITDLLSLRNNKRKAEVFIKMDAALDLMLSNTNDTKFFHKILLKEFMKAKQSNNSIKSISKSIQQLKKVYPKCFKFIVWDTNGMPVKSITDEKRFKYIVKNLYKLFKEIHETSIKHINLPIKNIEIVKKKINIFKKYLGIFLIPEHLRHPLLSSEQGQCVHADTQTGNPLFWFNYCQDFSIFCAINKNALGKYLGSMATAQELTKSETAFACGVIRLGEDITTYPRLNSVAFKELLLEFSKFENSSLPHIESANFLINIRLLAPNLRGFCIVRKKKHLTNTFAFKQRIAGTLFKYIIPFLFILYCHNLRVRHQFISIKLIIVGLLMYANILPLSILGIISAKYLAQSKEKILTKFHRENIQFINEIDLGYQLFLQELTLKVKKNLKQHFENFTDSQLDDGNTIKEMIKLTEALEIIVYGSNGKLVAKTSNNKKSLSKMFFKAPASSILRHSNMGIKDQFYIIEKEIQKKMLISVRFSGYTERVFRTLESVQYSFFGFEKKLFFIHLVKQKTSSKFTHLIFIDFDSEKIKKEYFQQKLAYFRNKYQNRFFAAMPSPNKDIIADSIFSRNSNLINFFHKTTFFKILEENSFDINGRNYAITATTGKDMFDSVFSIFSPIEIVTKKLQSTKFYVLLFLLFNLAISVAISIITLKQFLLPIIQLQNAISAIGNKNFRYQTRIETNDEFSQLGSALNSTIEEMSELEIGSTVQQNLFPPNQAKNGKISVFAQSIPMSKMGGDYYDYFIFDEHTTGFFMGDVSGHGIPAAIIAAMVKASLLMQKKEHNNPSHLLGKLNQLLCKVKSKKFRKLMSCQYLLFDLSQNIAQISNAGHCFPIRVTEVGKHAEFMEYNGNPIGISPAIKYKNFEFPIKSGETYILYSDGIMEGINSNNELFGDDRFLQLTKDAWSQDLSQYCKNMIAVYNEWAVKVDDDITLVIIRYEGT